MKRLIDLSKEELNFVCKEHNQICDNCPAYVNKIRICKFIPFIKNLKKSKEFLDREWKRKKLTDLTQEERLDIVKVFCKPLGCNEKCPFCYEKNCYKDLVESLAQENKEKTYNALEGLYNIEV